MTGRFAASQPGDQTLSGQAVLGFRRGVGRAGEIRQFGPRGWAQAFLRRVPRIVQSVAHAGPGRRPARRHEAVGARCRRTIGNALEGGDAFDDRTAHPARRGLHRRRALDRADIVHRIPPAVSAQNAPAASAVSIPAGPA